jgi:hypothetical protein
VVPHASGALQVPTVRDVRAIAEDFYGEDSKVRVTGEGKGGLKRDGVVQGGRT